MTICRLHWIAILIVMTTSLMGREQLINKRGRPMEAIPEALPTRNELYDEYQPYFWNSLDGLPYNRVTTIELDHHGYLWLGSYFGVSRFNGRSFVDINPYNTEGMESDTVNKILHPTGSDYLLIATTAGLYRCDGRTISSIPLEKGFDAVASMVEHKGVVWLATNRGLVGHQDGKIEYFGYGTGYGGEIVQNVSVWDERHLIAFIPKKIKLFDVRTGEFQDLPDEFPKNTTYQTRYGGIKQYDASGHVWYQCNEGIFKFLPGSPPEQVLTDTGTSGSEMLLLGIDSKGAVWVSREDGTVLRYYRGTVQSIALNPRFSVGIVETMFEDPHHNIWLGAEVGLVLLMKRQVDNYSVFHGMPHSYISCVSPFGDGRLAVGTKRGPAILDTLTDQITRFQLNGMDVYTRTILTEPDGSFWIGDENEGLFNIGPNGEMSPSPANRLWPEMTRQGGSRVWHLLRDPAGVLWAATMKGVFKVDGDDVVRYWKGSTPALPGNDIRVILHRPDGSVWMGSHGQGVMIMRDETVTQLTTENGMSGNEVFALMPDSDGETIWAATDDGITRIRRDRCDSVKRRSGIPPGTINQILEGHDGEIWITSQEGVHRLNRTNLNSHIDEGVPLELISIGAADGMLNSETNGESQPAGFVDDEGNLWIPSTRSLVKIDPKAYSELKKPAPPIVERIRLDGEIIYENFGPKSRDLNPREPFALTPSQGDLLEIEFAAPGINLFEEPQYEVMLSGHDSGWKNYGSRNMAIYTNLKPGDYRFDLKVAGSKNVWSDPATLFTFSRAPHFYQTWTFYLLAGLALLGFALFIHNRRMNVLYHIQQLEQTTALSRERTRIARDLHDEVGSRLTHITYLAELSTRETTSWHEQRTAELNQAARQAAQAMDEIVNTNRTEGDTLDNTINILIKHAENYLSVAGIACRNDASLDWPEINISADLYTCIFSTFKEAINNVIKHSGAREVWLHIHPDRRRVRIVIKDDGIGFDPQEVPGTGHDGLNNMRERMREIGGTCTITSTAGKGTAVEFAFEPHGG